MHPTLFQIGPLTIRTYGFMVAVGFLAALHYCLRRARREGIAESSITDLVLYAIVAGLVGARLAYVLFNLPFYLQHPADIFKVWEGGLVYFGGLVAGIVAVIVYLRSHPEIDLWKLADIAAPAIALGHFFGRLGCFFAGCCYGRPSDLPWAVTFCSDESLAQRGVALHPTQLYEAFGNLLLFVFLDRYVARPHVKGRVFAVYLVLYGLLRFAVEFLRGDERGAFLLGLSPGQVGSLVAVAAGAIIFSLRKNHESNR